MESFYLLLHKYNYGKNEEYTECKQPGIFSSKEKAREAIDCYIKQPGFCEYDFNCFKLYECRLDEPYFGEIITTRY